MSNSKIIRICALLREAGERLISLSEFSTDLDALLLENDFLGSQRPASERLEGSGDRLRAYLALEEHRERGRRARVFDASLFGEPAWDLLLDVYVSYISGRKLSVTAACLGANVPTSTALRWIGTLESHGLLLRETDKNDRRRYWIAPTEYAYQALGEYFDERANRRRHRFDTQKR